MRAFSKLDIGKFYRTETDNFKRLSSDKNKLFLAESYRTPTNNQDNKLHEENKYNLERIAEKSDEYCNGSQTKFDYMNESLLKTLSRVNNSFDSKDTVSLSEIDLDESFVDTSKVFGGNLDIEKIIQNQL